MTEYSDSHCYRQTLTRSRRRNAAGDLESEVTVTSHHAMIMMALRLAGSLPVLVSDHCLVQVTSPSHSLEAQQPASGLSQITGMQRPVIL